MFRFVHAAEFVRVFEEYSVIEVTDDAKAVEHAMYMLANPCSANLVRRPKQWSGFSTLWMKYGDTRAIERPRVGLWKRDVRVENRRRKKRRDPK